MEDLSRREALDVQRIEALWRKWLVVRQHDELPARAEEILADRFPGETRELEGPLRAVESPRGLLRREAARPRRLPRRERAQIGRASCRERGVDFGGRRIM